MVNGLLPSETPKNLKNRHFQKHPKIRGGPEICKFVHPDFRIFEKRAIFRSKPPNSGGDNDAPRN